MKPRIVWFCQPVAAAIAGSVAPFFCRSIARTWARFVPACALGTRAALAGPLARFAVVLGALPAFVRFAGFLAALARLAGVGFLAARFLAPGAGAAVSVSVVISISFSDFMGISFVGKN